MTALQTITRSQRRQKDRARYEVRKARIAAVYRDPRALRLDPTLLDDLDASDYLDLPLDWLTRAHEAALPLAVEAAGSACDTDDDRAAFHALVRVCVSTGQAIAARAQITNALQLIASDR